MPIVEVQLDREGAQALAEITRQHVGERLAIVLGDKIVSAPVIRESITGGSLEIDGQFTEDEAADLAAYLMPGNPLPVQIVSLSVIQLPTK